MLKALLMMVSCLFQEIHPDDYKQPYAAIDVPMQEDRQKAVDTEVGMQEDTDCMTKMREKREHEANNKKIGVEACEWKFDIPIDDDTHGLMQQMNVAWRRISGSPLLPAGFDRKVSISKPLYKGDFTITILYLL